MNVTIPTSHPAATNTMNTTTTMTMMMMRPLMTTVSAGTDANVKGERRKIEIPARTAIGSESENVIEIGTAIATGTRRGDGIMTRITVPKRTV
jgi:hypothetical protein